jgi:hypothetical protein
VRNIDTLNQRAREIDVHLAAAEITLRVGEKIAVKRPQASDLRLVAALQLIVAQESVDASGGTSWAAAIEEGESGRPREQGEAADVRRETAK